MKKKQMSILLAAVMCASALMGTAITVHAEEDYAGEIKVYGWTQMATALTQTAEKFMEKYPNAKIEVEQVDSQYTKLYPALASGQGVADVFMVQNTDIQAFVNKYEGQLMNLGELIEGEEDNFVASALRTCWNEEQAGYFGVPIDIGPCAMMYRTDIFEEHGIDAASIETWDDYIEAGKKIVEATDGSVKMCGFDFNGASSQDMLKMVFAQLGGSYYAEDGTVNLASAEMIQAATKIKEMVDAGIMMDFPNEWNDRITAIAANQICTLPYPAWYNVVMKDSAADQAGKWAYAPMPSVADESGYACLGGSVLAASATSEYPELCKAFIEYSLMNIECAEIMYDQGQFQAYKPFYEADCYKEVDEYFGIAIGETFSQWVDSPEINFGPYFTDVATGLTQAIGEIFVNGTDIETALTAATETAQRAVDNN